MKDLIRDAFLDVRNGHSPDVVIADPQLNEQFIAACRARGLVEPAAALNTWLYNARKSGAFHGFVTTRRAHVRKLDDYRFASEIAVRYLERQHQLTLDQVLCDPAWAKELDELAAKIAPGFTSFEYRWAALDLRKTRKLRPEILAKVVRAEQIVTCKVTALQLDQLSANAGLYLFFDAARVLYIGETENLRKRIKKHLEHSDNKGLAQWLWGHGDLELHLEYHILPAQVAARVRKALEQELIRSRHPVFNVAGKEPGK